MISKEELSEKIKNNTEEFNEAIKDCENIDLTETDFSNSAINGAIIKNADLTSSSFSDSQLTEVKFIDCDLTSVDFTRSVLTECSFNDSILNGTDFSYAKVDYCNFTDADLAGAILCEADLTNSDFTASENLNASRFDDTTIWPDNEYLPDGFDTSYTDDLSSLKDEEDYTNNDY